MTISHDPRRRIFLLFLMAFACLALPQSGLAQNTNNNIQTKGIDFNQAGPALRKLLYFDKKTPAMLERINALHNPELRDGVMHEFQRERTTLEIAAAVEGEAKINDSTITDPIILELYKNSRKRELQDTIDIKLYETEQRQKQLENRQGEIESRMDTEKAFQTLQNRIKEIR